MKPDQLDQGASATSHSTTALPLRYAIAQSDLGYVLIAASPQGLCSVELGDMPEQLVKQLCRNFPKARPVEDQAGLSTWVTAVLDCITHPSQQASHANLPLDMQGTAFQQRVWQALQQIPTGTTYTYTQLAEHLGQPASVRAVARACASNRMAVLIPCHRVIGKDGKLHGYRWGLHRKQALLAKEAVHFQP